MRLGYMRVMGKSQSVIMFEPLGIFHTSGASLA